MKNRWFTPIELAVLVAGLLILFPFAIVLFSALSRPSTRQPNDSAHLRVLGSALALWADHNDGRYPLPSELDRDNSTVPELGRAKDTTANIMSILVFEGYIPSELLVSPQETNPKIDWYENYETELPQAAVDPERALWDPGFSADFTSEAGGNISYAHLIPVGERLEMWTNTGKSDEVIASNRGPEIASVERDAGDVTTQFVKPDSNTTFIHGEGTETWSGHLLYNDTHVVFEQDRYTHNGISRNSGWDRKLGGTEYHDVIFHDEEGFPSNHFLGIFTRAGETKEDYRAIWD